MGNKLNDTGLRIVWNKVWSLIKTIVGDVDVDSSGTLQDQITNHTDTNATSSVSGHVKLSDTYNSKVSSGAAANGLGASQNALYNAYNALNTAKLATTGDTKNNVTAFTSADSTSVTAWTNVSVLATGEKHSSIFNKISTMFKNIRYLYKMIGTTDISKIGDGTLTGGLSTLNSNLSNRYTKQKILYKGTCGTASDIPLSESVTGFDEVKVELMIDIVILASNRCSKASLTNENLRLRASFCDMSKFYYQDISYASDTALSVSSNQSDLSFRVIGIKYIY